MVNMDIKERKSTQEKFCVAILAQMKKGCGNNTTANRIRYYLERNNIQCVVCNSEEFEDGAEFLNYIYLHNISYIFGLHALHAGKWLQHIESAIPFIIIFGGTDLNEYCNDPKSLKIMTRAVENSRLLICFSEEMKKRATSLWPSIDDTKVKVIAQGNRLFVAPRCKPCMSPVSKDSQDKYGLNQDAIILSLVAGIRPVKDPIFLLKKFSEWHARVNSNCYLLIAGPVINIEYSKVFYNVLKDCQGVKYLGILSPKGTQELMLESLVVVNSSVSEGMCVSLLEAMDLSVPVIARNNAGNQSIVKNGVNGYLYSTPQEFVSLVCTLLEDNQLYSQLCTKAKVYVNTYHNSVLESTAYTNIIETIKSSENPIR